jgi:hypothetical protein
MASGAPKSQARDFDFGPDMRAAIGRSDDLHASVPSGVEPARAAWARGEPWVEGHADALRAWAGATLAALPECERHFARKRGDSLTRGAIGGLKEFLARLRDDLLEYVFSDTSQFRSVSTVDAQSAADNELQAFWDVWDGPFGLVESYFRYTEAHEGKRPARGQETRTLSEFQAMQDTSLEIQRQLPDLLVHAGEVLKELLGLLESSPAAEPGSPPPD